MVNVPRQDIVVKSNIPGELKLLVAYSGGDKIDVYFRYDEGILATMDDIAALVHLFSGRN